MFSEPLKNHLKEEHSSVWLTILWVNNLDRLRLVVLLFTGLAHTPVCSWRGGGELAGPEYLICMLDKCLAVGQGNQVWLAHVFYQPGCWHESGRFQGSEQSVQDLLGPGFGTDAPSFDYIPLAKADLRGGKLCAPPWRKRWNVTCEVHGYKEKWRVVADFGICHRFLT